MPRTTAILPGIFPKSAKGASWSRQLLECGDEAERNHRFSIGNEQERGIPMSLVPTTLKRRLRYATSPHSKTLSRLAAPPARFLNRIAVSIILLIIATL